MSKTLRRSVCRIAVGVLLEDVEKIAAFVQRVEAINLRGFREVKFNAAGSGIDRSHMTPVEAVTIT